MTSATPHLCWADKQPLPPFILLLTLSIFSVFFGKVYLTSTVNSECTLFPSKIRPLYILFQVYFISPNFPRCRWWLTPTCLILSHFVLFHLLYTLCNSEAYTRMGNIVLIFYFITLYNDPLHLPSLHYCFSNLSFFMFPHTHISFHIFLFFTIQYYNSLHFWTQIDNKNDQIHLLFRHDNYTFHCSLLSSCSYKWCVKIL